MEKLLTPDEVAELLRIDAGTLANWRCAGRGPGFVKLAGASVRYPLEDLQAFVAAGRRPGEGSGTGE